MRNLMSYVAFLLVFLVASIISTPASATSLVSNLTESRATRDHLGKDYANSFRTGGASEGYTLRWVEVDTTGTDAECGGDGDHWEIKIANANNNFPTTTLAESGDDLVPIQSGSSRRRWTLSTGLTLARNTTYFIVLDAFGSGDGATDCEVHLTTSDDESANAPGWSIGNTGITSPKGSNIWTDISSNRNLVFKLDGTIKDKPGAPRSLSTSVPSAPSGRTRIDLAWNVPTNTGTPSLTDYEIQWSANGTSNWATISEGEDTGRTYAHTGLTPGTRYYYRVRASNTHGDGEWSNVANATTRAADTTAPTVTSIEHSSTAVTLTFNERTDIDAPISAFTARITRNSVEHTAPIQSLFQDSIGSRNKLKIHLDYRFRVGDVVRIQYADPTSGNDDNSLQDTSGNDVASFAREITVVQQFDTDYDPPLPIISVGILGANWEPTDLEASSTFSSVKLSWDIPLLQKIDYSFERTFSEVQEYAIEWSEDGTSGWQQVARIDNNPTPTQGNPTDFDADFRPTAKYIHTYTHEALFTGPRWYRIRAVNDIDNKSPSSNVVRTELQQVSEGQTSTKYYSVLHSAALLVKGTPAFGCNNSIAGSECSAAISPANTFTYSGITYTIRQVQSSDRMTIVMDLSGEISEDAKKRIALQIGNTIYAADGGSTTSTNTRFTRSWTLKGSGWNGGEAVNIKILLARSDIAPQYFERLVRGYVIESPPPGTVVDFDSPTRAYNFDEHTDVGKPVYTLTGRDADKFDVDATTGIVTTKAGVVYDYETQGGCRTVAQWPMRRESDPYGYHDKCFEVMINVVDEDGRDELHLSIFLEDNFEAHVVGGSSTKDYYGTVPAPYGTPQQLVRSIPTLDVTWENLVGYTPPAAQYKVYYKEAGRYYPYVKWTGNTDQEKMIHRYLKWDTEYEVRVVAIGKKYGVGVDETPTVTARTCPSKQVGVVYGENTVMVTKADCPIPTTNVALQTVAEPLTAEFQNGPSRHDGANVQFSIQVLFNTPLSVSWTNVRDAITVSGGTKDKVHRVDRRSDLWNIVVTPSSGESVSIAMSPTFGTCEDANALCTKDGTKLMNGYTKLILGPDLTVPLTVSLEDLPSEHIEEPFTFKVNFSEALSQSYSYRTMRDHSINITQGDTRLTPHVRRLAGNAKWQIEVTPLSKEDVTVVMIETTDCSDTGAMCAGEKKLSNSVNAIIQGPPSISIADAEVIEADTTIDFTVSLSRTSDYAFEVDYTTEDNTATAGEDYQTKTGRIAFPAGTLTKKISITIMDDDHDENSETFLVKLSNPTNGAWLKDSTATGTINNSDLMPQAWLARFGRTIAEQVTEAVEDRIFAVPQHGMKVNINGHQVGGQHISENEWMDQKDTKQKTGAITEQALLLGSSFMLTNSMSSGHLSLWGRGASSSFRGREIDLSIEGKVNSVMLGTDWDTRNRLVGLMVAHSSGHGSYKGEGEGEVESTLTGIYPYARYTINDRMSVWGNFGYGYGSLALKPKTEKGSSTISSDMNLITSTVGLRGVIVKADRGIEIAAKTDAMGIRTTSEKSGTQPKTTADVTRVRLGLEGKWHGLNLGGSNLIPGMEIGIRHDGGDAETGFGADIGGSIAWKYDKYGIAMNVSARGLLTHEANGFRNKGISGSFAWKPNTVSNRGPNLTLTQTVGASSTGGVNTLLEQKTLEGISSQDTEQERFDMRMGYGLSIMGGRYTLTPEIGLGLTNDNQEYVLGWRYNNLEQFGYYHFELRLEATRQTYQKRNNENTVKLLLSIGW